MKTLSAVLFALALSLAPLFAQTSVPPMTSATSPSGLVTQSGIFSPTYPGWQAFDSVDNTMWISAVGQTPAWIGYEFSGPKRVVSYAIRYANGTITTRAPKNWTLEAWNGFFWVVLDARSNQINWRNEERSFPVSSPGLYARYRLNITDDNDARAGVVVISIGKLSLRADDQAGGIDWNQLFQHWHFDANQSAGAVEHFVPIDVEVPLLRFIPAMIFHADGGFEKLILAPNDAHYYSAGTWSRTGNRISTVVNDRRLGTLVDSFDVLTLTSGVLRIQH